MSAFDTTRNGREPFDVRPVDRDYSSLDIENRYLENANLEKSFFNGVNLFNCSFESVTLNNTEFSEATISRCHFERCDLSAADYVDSAFEDCVFFRCSFEKGEWRGSTFQRCYFVECTFDHTTMTLCAFRNGVFDTQSSLSMQHRAVYYNVFSYCVLHAEPTTLFATRNFGVDVSEWSALSWPAKVTSIEKVCQLNSCGALRTELLTDAVLTICESLTRQKRSSELAFFSRIIGVLTEERRISATSLTYLQHLMTSFAATITDRELLMAAMATVLEIHNALLMISAEAESDQHSYSAALLVRKLSIYFTRSYSAEHVAVLGRALSRIAGVDDGQIRVVEMRKGSTFIEMATTGMVSAATLLTALNFVLRQATVTVNEAARFRKAMGKHRGASRPTARRSSLAIRQVPTVQAVLQPQAAVPALARVSEAVSRDGRVLVALDEPADVSVLTQEPNRGRQ